MDPGNRSARFERRSVHRLAAGLALLLLVGAGLFRPGTLAAAQTMPPIYEQNFAGQPEGWYLEDSENGMWWVENGQLNATGHVWAVYDAVDWGSGQHSLEFDLVIMGENGGLHANLQHSNQGRYLLGFRATSASRLYVYLSRNTWGGAEEALASANFDSTAGIFGQALHVKAVFGDGQFSIYVNRAGQEIFTTPVPLLTAADPQPLPSGWISFENLEETPARIDNLVVYGPRFIGVIPPAPEQPVQTEPPAQPEPGEPEVPGPQYEQCYGEGFGYSDDFETGNAPNWDRESSEYWFVVNGMYQGSRHLFTEYNGAMWEDLTLYVIYRQPEGGAVHVNLRKSDTGRYFVGVSPEGLNLVKQVGWGAGEEFIDLAYAPLHGVPGEWHTLVFAAHGGDLAVTHDGELLIESYDSQPLPGGRIAFETLDENPVLLDAVWVCGKFYTPTAQARTQPPARPTPVQPTAVVAQPPEQPPTTRRLPDLVIGGIAAESYDATNQQLLLRVTVTNTGQVTSDASQVRVQEQYSTGKESFYNLVRLNPGQSRELLIQLAIPDRLVGKSTRYDVEADPGNQVRETDENNNVVLSGAIQFPPPSSPPRGGWWPYALAGAGGAALIYVLARRLLRRKGGRGTEPPEEEPHGPLPIPPPVRLLNVWLTEGSTGRGKRLSDDQPLVTGRVYSLHAQVVSHAPPRRRKPAGGSPVPLEAVVFSPNADLSVQNRPVGLTLPGEGSSGVIHWPFRASEPGLRRARVCLYYGSLLLQSAYVEAEVVTRTASRRKPAAGAVQRMVDYVASASLTGLERQPQPAVSIFTNQASNHEGWIGVYARAGTGQGEGILFQVNPEQVRSRAGPVRRRLLEIEESFNDARQSPAAQATAHQITRLEQDLAGLACSGWTMYDQLFLQAGSASKAQKELFTQALRAPGLIAIDRCRSEKTTLPWAAVYDLEVDTGKEDLLRLCPAFKAELEGHWPGDGTHYRAYRDWLDNPEGCRSNPRCPLHGDDELLTICPMAFWGFRHQISQPLQSVHPTPAGQVPEEVTNAGEYQGVSSFDSTIFLRRQPAERLKLAVGVHPGLAQATRLPVDITALRPGELEVTYEDARDRVLEMLKHGGYHLVVLYCHGDRDEREEKFKLVFGPLADERSISCENLNPLKITWPEQPKPLVLLNGCETVAVTPEMVHGLLDRLHELGAAGVVGTEIQVYPSLAYPLGLEILERLLCGESVGEAFLAERKELLRQFNPLGLAYTYYAPAALHVHAEGGCGWCNAHHLPQHSVMPA